ncbi:MAG TPA: hybrid sensor histidine kinase/response regulator, partial [Gammaproteobacteria bacterium]|nr:hybrid sensor histidine kinase/response regulator [Gammaproteobacteria bacterium]
ILIVDDNPQIRKMLQRHLKKKGYETFEAENGKMGLVEVEKAKPDLILLDVMMPEMNGFEVCQRLKQDAALKDIPVIFMTAKTETDDVIAGLELGAVDYVAKPFNHKELMTRVNTHLELKAAKDMILLQREELKQANEELKNANAAKDKFFSIISHDLGNLFNTLIGFSSLLTMQTDTISAEEKENFILSIQRASQKGYSLLSNLLEWAMAQTGQITSKAAILNLKSLVADNMALLNSNANAKSIKLSSSISETSTVFADKNMLDTVIRNLLANAIKFTPVNGEVKIVSEEKGSEVEISISDTGVGINPKDIDKLFRVDISHTTIGTGEEKGTGLGLILCKEFVEKNGGTIWVESEMGKGSRFYIRLSSQ